MFLKENFDDSELFDLVAVGSDYETVVNTGVKGGVIRLLEKE